MSKKVKLDDIHEEKKATVDDFTSTKGQKNRNKRQKVQQSDEVDSRADTSPNNSSSKASFLSTSRKNDTEQGKLISIEDKPSQLGMDGGDS